MRTGAMVRHGAWISICTVVTALAAASSASADTFAGHCQFGGSVTFEPAITVLPATGLDLATSAGTCSGRLTYASGQTTDLSDSPTTLIERQQGLIWCLAGTSTGIGEFDFTADHDKLAFHVTEQRGPGFATLELTGATGGSALGAAAITPAFALTAARLCAGTGLARAPIHLTIVATPSISG
jgi:hypothetical protein